ncbi:E1 ubiquitin-activating protein uba2 [Serendipita sp. 396]|nr:E1 ubiquitin-activating protein uba2 [Serendipita sp. 396]KAG8789363.1 E1 ubiquitin-activating protein uba2 [Serendipita sp. 397]KAG8804596.1 E1 ubiquitin-activating protein uba2 [Serendipita sp. 398]KAG8878717.1 E1 ubiquitin-activating protein uba2 [Serendipita sp. 405]
MRSSSAATLFGSDFAQSIKDTRILVVGSGGIGCELLKNIVLVGFGDITLLDLDTIDLSNLNRQFLFRKKDVKQPKALVAARTASAFNPSVKITPLCANIKEPKFDANWFASFHLVMSALDNLDARKHINRMCLAAGVPLVESGTEGYFGQVQPILKGETECYECTPKPVQQRTYPVCTIRSTPSQPIHSIVWAKSYLLPQLFGEEENEAELDKAEQDGENPNEIAALREEAQEWKRMRAALRSPNTTAGKVVFEKAFKRDTEKLLKMDDMWQNRQKPVPLEFELVAEGTFLLRGVKQKRYESDATTSSTNGQSHTSGLRDQRSLTLPESLDLFVSSVERLSSRLQAGEDIITFDKDDDDTLDFVTAASNLRSAVYNIPQKNRWDVKETAGNIIPAIATTNAIIAGLIVLQAVQILRKRVDSLSWPYLTAKPNKPITGSQLPTPNPSCAACADTYIVIRCNPAVVTLSQLVNVALENTDLEDEEDDGLDTSSVSVFEAGRLLSDPDFDDNLEKTLADLSCGQGKFVSIVDEDERWNTLTVAICLLPDNVNAGDSELLLPNARASLKRKSKAEVPTSLTENMDVDRNVLKRKLADEAEIVEEEDGPARKKARPNNRLPSSSPTKAQRLEEDGLVILEDDVTIVLD